jgi:hypothetical protein
MRSWNADNCKLLIDARLGKNGRMRVACVFSGLRRTGAHAMAHIQKRQCHRAAKTSPGSRYQRHTLNHLCPSGINSSFWLDTEEDGSNVDVFRKPLSGIENHQFDAARSRSAISGTSVNAHDLSAASWPIIGI